MVMNLPNPDSNKEDDRCTVRSKPTIWPDWRRDQGEVKW